MRIVIGADHAGFELKQNVRDLLRNLDHQVLDVGTHSADPVDYPDCAEAVGVALREGRADRGIIICGSGVGTSVAANKIPGIRAYVGARFSGEERHRRRLAKVIALEARYASPSQS